MPPPDQQSPTAVPPHDLPDSYFADWNPLVVNEYISRLSREDQISLALAAVSWAADPVRTAPNHPVAACLAGAQDDLTQALQLLQ